jgi:hypothetical protein
MVKRFYLIGLIFLGTFNCSAATISDLSKTVLLLEKVSPSYEKRGDQQWEVWLKNPSTNKLEQKFDMLHGTGFIIDYHGRLYLVSAAHVAQIMDSDALIMWKNSSGKTQSFTFKFLQDKIPNARWFFHPQADIALHPLGFSEKTSHVAIPGEVFSISADMIELLTEVSILGFPFGFGAKDTLNPIASRSSIANPLTAIDMNDINPNLEFILLTDGLATGYSGAPVFTMPSVTIQESQIKVKSGIHLIGLQSRTVSDKTGGKISMVVPIAYLNQLLESKDFQDYERTIKQH